MTGIKPHGSFYKNESELRNIVTKFVTKMIQDKVRPEDIVILTTSSVSNSMLRNTSAVNGVSISTKPNKNSILFTSVRKFKGLEAKAVLLIDVLVDRLTNELHKRLVYVGSSRANTYLQLAFYDNIPSEDYKIILNHLGIDVVNNTGKEALLDTFGLDLLK